MYKEKHNSAIFISFEYLYMFFVFWGGYLKSIIILQACSVLTKWSWHTNLRRREKNPKKNYINSITFQFCSIHKCLFIIIL